MGKFNEEALDAAINKSAMKVSVEIEELQAQTIIRNIPKAWISAVKNKAHATLGGYMKAALREKLERDGLI